MAKLVKTKKRVKKVVPRTHGGGAAVKISNPALQLRRLVMANMLWEDQFYIDGKDSAGLIQAIVPQVDPSEVAAIAVTAREKGKLRHVPLLLVRELARQRSFDYKGQALPVLTYGVPESLVSETLQRVIQRPDELTEFLAIYWKDGKQPLSNQVKKGLAAAFGKFSEYQLAKYDREGDIKLRDVMFLTHPNPNKTNRIGRTITEQEFLFNQIAERKLTPPDTWEVELSAGKDKKETWERLIRDEKLGGLAILRNLRNMQDAKVGTEYIRQALINMNSERVLPFRFISASKYAPKFLPELETAMFKSLAGHPSLKGKTVIVVDVSGSMFSGQVSAKSDLSRMDGAKALAMLLKELSEDGVVYTTAGSDGRGIHATEKLRGVRGFALGEEIDKSAERLGGGGIFLTQSTEYISKLESGVDRFIVITDEQDTDHKLNASKAIPPGKFNYILNIAAYRNGIGAQGLWDKVDGFSEAVVDYIMNLEDQGLNLVETLR